MIKKERIAIKLCIRNNLEYVREWIMQMKKFNPSDMKFQHYKKGRFVSYNEKVFLDEMNKEMMHSEYNLFLKDTNNCIYCFVNGNSNNIAILTAILENDIFRKNENNIYIY